MSSSNFSFRPTNLTLSLPPTDSVDFLTKKLQSLLCDDNQALHWRIDQQSHDMRVSYEIALAHSLDEIRVTVKSLAEAQRQAKRDMDHERERTVRKYELENRRRRDRTVSPDARNVSRYRPAERDRERERSDRDRPPRDERDERRRAPFDVGSGPTPTYKSNPPNMASGQRAALTPGSRAVALKPNVWKQEMDKLGLSKLQTSTRPALRAQAAPQNHAHAPPQNRGPATMPANTESGHIHPDRIRQMSAANRSPSPPPSAPTPLKLTGANADAFMQTLAASAAPGNRSRLLQQPQPHQGFASQPGFTAAAMNPGQKPLPPRPSLKHVARDPPPANKPSILQPGFATGVPSGPRSDIKIRPEELERTVFNLREKAKATMPQNRIYKPTPSIGGDTDMTGMGNPTGPPAAQTGSPSANVPGVTVSAASEPVSGGPSVTGSHPTVDKMAPMPSPPPAATATLPQNQIPLALPDPTAPRQRTPRREFPNIAAVMATSPLPTAAREGTPPPVPEHKSLVKTEPEAKVLAGEMDVDSAETGAGANAEKDELAT